MVAGALWWLGDARWKTTAATNLRQSTARLSATGGNLSAASLRPLAASKIGVAGRRLHKLRILLQNDMVAGTAWRLRKPWDDLWWLEMCGGYGSPGKPLWHTSLAYSKWNLKRWNLTLNDGIEP